MKKILTSHGRLVAMLASMLLFSLAVLAQETHPVSGTVLDEKGAPLQGVSVVIKGTTLGTVTDTAGRFTIRVGKGATLVFSYIKYGTQEIPIKAQRTVTISMTPTTSSLNDVIVVGYGTQRKATLTGAVAQIGNAEIVTTKNENIENMLTGKVPGLQILQNTAEPGDFANNISIRGMGNPIIVINGVVMNDFSITGNNGDNNVGTSNILSRLDPNDIESISVLKDASAAVYGIRSANGVIMVTTKKGKAGTMELSYNGTYGVQVPSGLPKPVDALQYMQLVNQQDLHNANGGIISYDSADFAAYRNGTLKTTDWYDAVFKKRTPQMQHNITATGGNENTTYLISAGYLYQDGLLTSNDLNYHRYNVRSNITTKIGKRFTVNLNVSGIMDKKNQPAESFWWTTRETWRELPTQTIYANNTAPYYTNGLVDGGNPVAFENSDIVGYNNLSNTWINAAISIDYKVPFVEGLTLRGFFSYNDQIQDNKLYQKSFDLYNYNDATQTYKATLNGSPSYVQRQYYRYPQNDDQFSLNYAHSFGNHNITALLLMEGAEQSADNFASYRQLSIPVDQLIAGNAANQNATQDGGNTALYQYATNSWVGRVTYDFSSRYLAEFSFRDDKSSKFAPGQGWGFFPSGSIGWRINEENFFRNSNKLSFIDNLKLRASYGLTGSDGPLYYQFLTGYTYPASGNNNQLPRGSVFGNNFINAVQSTGIPNPNITWIRAHTFDAGIDFDAWKGLLGFTVDYFRRDLKGILATSVLQVPEVLGAPLPEENINGTRTQGFDLEVNHHNHIGKFGYNVKATFSYTNTRNTAYAESKQGNSYLDWRNAQADRNQGIQWGYGSAGQYQNYNQILNNNVYVGRGAVVGDYIYEDWNGDGQIDGNDNHPIAYGPNPNGLPVLPKITYGLTLGGTYEGFDVSLLFQGTSIYSVSYIEQLNIPLWGGGSALTQFLNDYHPADPNANPYNPGTVWVPGNFAYTGTTANTNSSFNFYNGAYLRLKSAELGYSLPDKLIKRSGLKGVRFFLTGYNLVTFTKVKYVDPEHPSGMYGYLYPLDKIYNFGLNVKF